MTTTRSSGVNAVNSVIERHGATNATTGALMSPHRGVESTADRAHLSRRQRCQSVQDAAHKRLQMNHAVRRRSNDHDAQPKGTQILLVLKTPIHAQQDIETPLSTPN